MPSSKFERGLGLIASRSYRARLNAFFIKSSERCAEFRVYINVEVTQKVGRH